MRTDVGSCAKTRVAVSGAASLPEENQPSLLQQPLIAKVLQREAELRELLTLCAEISDVVQVLCKHSTAACAQVRESPVTSANNV